MIHILIASPQEGDLCVITLHVQMSLCLQCLGISAPSVYTLDQTIFSQFLRRQKTFGDKAKMDMCASGHSIFNTFCE